MLSPFGAESLSAFIHFAIRWKSATALIIATAPADKMAICKSIINCGQGVVAPPPTSSSGSKTHTHGRISPRHVSNYCCARRDLPPTTFSPIESDAPRLKEILDVFVWIMCGAGWTYKIKCPSDRLRVRPLRRGVCCRAGDERVCKRIITLCILAL